MKKEVNIPALKKEEATFEIEGVTSLIVHRFGSKAIKMIQDKQDKKAKNRAERDPKSEMEDCLHYFSDKKRTGFPVGGFKQAMVRAGKYLEYEMVNLKGMFSIVADEDDLVEINGDYELRTDMVRVANGSPDIRHRPEYKNWGVNLRIQYNANSISVEQLAQLVNMAGFSCGIGDWRPSSPKRSGDHGVFKIKE